METLSAFFHMGGYAGYVWPAYGAAVVLLAVLLVASLRGTRRQERALEAVQALRRPHRVRRS